MILKDQVMKLEGWDEKWTFSDSMTKENDKN
jgi:hypothetical protein